MKGRDAGFEGKGLLKCLWCFLVILRAVIEEESVFFKPKKKLYIYDTISYIEVLNIPMNSHWS